MIFFIGGVNIRALIDTIFNPVLQWLTSIYNSIMSLTVPVSRPFNIDNYFGVFGLMGSGWTDFVKTVCALAFIYCLCYVVVTQAGLFQKFKDFIKWW